jgi:hypothetical protein
MVPTAEVWAVQSPAAAYEGSEGDVLGDEDLVRRYTTGDSVRALAEDAEMTLAGVLGPLRRLGVPPPTSTPSGPLGETVIREALLEHGSISAAAKALGVTRNTLTGEAVRLGVVQCSVDIPPDLADRYRTERSLARVAAHYGVSIPTVSRWLNMIGVPRQRGGRRPRDRS